MGGLFLVLVLAIGALVAWGQLSRRMARVHDASGRSVGTAEAARVAGSPASTADQGNQHGRNETE